LIAEDVSWEEFETISTPHDGADGVAFVVDDGRSRLGILTDLGYVFSRLQQVIGTLDAVLLESNYDPAMLAGGPHPAFLKQRIAGSVVFPIWKRRTC
jgi:phosphoribosyl 1,2-cyclic phosphodiesterase